VPESATQPESGSHWEERVLKRLAFAGPVPRDASKLWYVVIAAAAVALATVQPARWWALPVGLVLGALGLVYWTAFWCKVVREFRAGYRDRS
jgi:hypothetical protein